MRVLLRRAKLLIAAALSVVIRALSPAGSVATLIDAPTEPGSEVLVLGAPVGVQGGTQRFEHRKISVHGAGLSTWVTASTRQATGSR